MWVSFETGTRLHESCECSQLLVEGPAHVSVPRNQGATQTVVLPMAVLPVIKVLKDLPTLVRCSQARVELPRIVSVAPAEGILPASKQLHTDYNNGIYDVATTSDPWRL